MPQPAVRSVAHAIATGATSVTCNKPAGAVSGDVLIAVVATMANTAITNTAVANLTWARIGAQTNNGAGLTFTVFAHRISAVAGREPASYTFNDGATVTNWAISIVCYTGMDFFARLGTAAVTTVLGTTVNSPSQSNTNFADVITVAGVASGSNSVFSGPTAGFFIEDQINNPAGVSVALIDNQTVAPFPAGTGTLAVTTSNPGLGVGISSTWPPSDLQLQLQANVNVGPALVVNVVDDM